MRILILGAGTAASNEEEQPVWIAEQVGKTFIERIIEACASLDATLIFAVREEDIRRHRIDSVIRIADSEAHVVPVSGDTSGAPCTALLCSHLISEDDELLILNGNDFLNAEYSEIISGFRSRSLDAGVVCFRSLHPRYSYMRVNDEGLVVEASEKCPISRHATAGFYWFRCGKDFISAAQDMIRKDAHIEGRFFISLTFNELILKQKRIGLTEVDPRRYIPLKSRSQILAYEADHGGDIETRTH